jgi:hypothetical protein
MFYSGKKFHDTAGLASPGLPDGIFSNQNFHFGSWRVLQWKMLVYLMTIGSYLLPFDLFCGHLVYFMVIWYVFSRFGMLNKEKSGNPELHSE